jgi:hypothetical protein
VYIKAFARIATAYDVGPSPTRKGTDFTEVFPPYLVVFEQAKLERGMLGEGG